MLASQIGCLSGNKVLFHNYAPANRRDGEDACIGMAQSCKEHETIRVKGVRFDSHSRFKFDNSGLLVSRIKKWSKLHSNAADRFFCNARAPLPIKKVGSSSLSAFEPHLSAESLQFVRFYLCFAAKNYILDRLFITN